MLDPRYAQALDNLADTLAEALGRVLVLSLDAAPEHRAALHRIQSDLSSALIDTRQLTLPF